MSDERPYFVTSDATSTPPVEMYSLEEQRGKLVVASGVDLKDEVADLNDAWRHALPVAAEVLRISPNLSDYILVPVISMPSDLPNRNNQAFPFTALTSWVPDHGMVMYKTWRGKPLHYEHNNADPTIAKGIIFDCIMRPIEMSAGDIWKVIKLAGIDRSRDPVLASDILSGARSSYSMGANARDFSCSICGTTVTAGGCEHVKHGSPGYRLFDGKLAHFNIVDPVGFELSSVANPAYSSALNNPILGEWR